MQTMIIFGPLFTHAERTWNRLLAEAIQKASGASIQVILPQEETQRLLERIGAANEQDAIAQMCFDNAINADVAVAILDGADADSGTCVEIGWRKGQNPSALVIGVRTDSRISEDQGLNLMLGRGLKVRACDIVLYFTSWDTDLEQIAKSIVAEAQRVTRTIRSE